MRLLLDTHMALWAIADSPQLPAKARALIADPANEVFVSAGSLWEIAIKHALKRSGRNAMPIGAAAARGFFSKAGYALLPMTPDHVCALEALAPIHGDPFDRILVAQASVEPMRLLTHDQRLGRYGAFVSCF